MRCYTTCVELTKSALERLQAIRDYLEEQLDMSLGLSEVLCTIIEQVQLDGVE